MTKQLAIASLLLACPFASASTFVPSPFIGVYEASMNDRVIDDEAKQRLTKMGNDRYRFSIVAKNFLFDLEEHCTFTLKNDHLQSLNYQSVRGSFFKKKKKQINFDWNTKQAAFHNKKWNGNLPLNENSFAPQCSLLELSRRIKSGAKTVSFSEVTAGKIKQRDYQVVGSEKINVPYGTIDTIKVQRVSAKPNTNNGKETYIWFAPDLNYLAVKVLEQKDKGDTYKLQLKALY